MGAVSTLTGEAWPDTGSDGGADDGGAVDALREGSPPSASRLALRETCALGRAVSGTEGGCVAGADEGTAGAITDGGGVTDRCETWCTTRAGGEAGCGAASSSEGGRSWGSGGGDAGGGEPGGESGMVEGASDGVGSVDSEKGLPKGSSSST